MPAGRSQPLLEVLLVEDHQLLAQTLALALGMEGIGCTVADLSDRARLLEAVRASVPDLVLLDLDLGGTIGDGSRLVAPIVEAGSRVLVVSASTDRDQICRALEDGAVGVVAKSLPFDQLLATTLAVAHGEEVLPAPERCRMLASARTERGRRAAAVAPFQRLTPRETEVLTALAAGRSVTVIANDSFVSEATVRTQVRGVLTKLGVGSQLEAVALAHRSGWLALSPSGR